MNIPASIEGQRASDETSSRRRFIRRMLLTLGLVPVAGCATSSSGGGAADVGETASGDGAVHNARDTAVPDAALRTDVTGDAGAGRLGEVVSSDVGADTDAPDVPGAVSTDTDDGAGEVADSNTADAGAGDTSDGSGPPDVTDTSDTSDGQSTHPDVPGDAAEVIDDAGVPCAPTQPDAQGPFYEPDAPEITLIAPPNEPGQPVSMTGVVYGPDCTTPLSGATVEVWQADASGEYHDSKLRGTLTTDGSGAFAFDTIKPGAYLQPGGFRPAHLHLKVSAPGHATLVTQVYFEGDPYLAPNDSCGGCGSNDPARIIPLETLAQGLLSGQFDVVLGAA